MIKNMIKLAKQRAQKKKDFFFQIKEKNRCHKLETRPIFLNCKAKYTTYRTRQNHAYFSHCALPKNVK